MLEVNYNVCINKNSIFESNYSKAVCAVAHKYTNVKSALISNCIKVPPVLK